ncbi:SF1B family DNA helicase RecD2 [Phosphitispora fastidiosa]|uniref:SF1B family DNA helicase RecD2 n=1 Tax=Phosphitispora fastidiosa TaxID=2837202 RepID=UPI001E3277E0|nr:ATP-dependent RecD-like DNA helicase [Phosphitispora fastidiosa]MBU7006341.1 exodeoxyribonuclease V alpha subunit [Phosphitispora fastidiosa]
MTPRTARKKKQEVPATDKLRGTVQRIKYGPKADNGFVIFSLQAGSDIFNCKGNVTGIRELDEVELTGSWFNDAKWGKQFNFVSCDIQIPTTKTGITSYLTSTAFGVGYVKANAIYDTLGENCLDIIQKEGPGCLLKVKGITPEMAEEVHKHLTANSVVAELSALICREGVTPNLAVKIYNAFGQDAVRTVKENPFVLADHIHGVGFKLADRVAYSVGVLPNDPHRIEAAIEFALKEAGNDGHCYLRPRDIVPAVLKLCGKTSGVDVGDIAQANAKIIRDERCIREGNCIYPVKMYEAEVSLANRIRALNRQRMLPPVGIDNMVQEFEKLINIEYAPEQRGAVVMVLSNCLSIITGGPGTGKSTVINGIVSIYKDMYPDKPIYLAAPTGRAAKRITETTGIDGLTLHRLLKYNPECGFQHNELNQLESGLLVVDEYSMADVELSDSLFRALPLDMQVVLVGDVDQLPSVGPGSVLRDCISSQEIPTTFLEYNYRQAQGSKIAEFAHRIRQGQEIPLYEQFDDYVCRLVDDAEGVAGWVETEVRNAVLSGMGIMDFQVLCPMRKGSAGVNALNDLIRDIVNPEAPDNKTKSFYRIKDKVMVIRNDYNKLVFNGDIGQIIATGEEPNKSGANVEGVYINFGNGTDIFFPYDDLDEVVLAYASTIHKSQGSEFPLVIMPIVNQHYIMLQRNLIYTGITRAKNKLVLVCQEQSVSRAIQNDRIAERHSRLKERLKGE